jgi:hypothetical protein
MLRGFAFAKKSRSCQSKIASLKPKIDMRVSVENLFQGIDNLSLLLLSEFWEHGQ